MQQHLNILVTDLETRLSAARNATRVPQVEAYMKNHFSFFGMESSVRKAVQKPWIQLANTLESSEDRWKLVLLLFDQNEREYQYVAIDWLNTWKKGFFQEEDANYFHQLITTKSWWDSDDAIASNALGTWASLFPDKAKVTFQNWKNDTSFWVQRSCLIYQLKYKNEVDVAFLEEMIAHLLPLKEFFIQKAIGWSLRQLSKFQPLEVERILSEYEIQGLARREASKYL